METVKNPISGAEMIVPSTKLSREIHSALCCVTEISDWEEHHSDAFGIQQEILELIETEGPQAAGVRVAETRDKIERVFHEGKTDEVLAILGQAKE
ncbi:MAG: hypothetical protein WCX61_02455 [Candidatus Peribacteraceae bacterium]|jgi:hypothetical protein